MEWDTFMQQRIGLGSEDSPSFWAIQHLPGEQGKRMPLYNATVQPRDITFFCFFSLALSLSLCVPRCGCSSELASEAFI